MRKVVEGWQPETYDAFKKLQKAMFVIQMNAHKPATFNRQVAIAKAAYDLQVAADQFGCEYP